MLFLGILLYTKVRHFWLYFLLCSYSYLYWVRRFQLIQNSLERLFACKGLFIWARRPGILTWVRSVRPCFYIWKIISGSYALWATCRWDLSEVGWKCPYERAIRPDRDGKFRGGHAFCYCANFFRVRWEENSYMNAERIRPTQVSNPAIQVKTHSLFLPVDRVGHAWLTWPAWTWLLTGLFMHVGTDCSWLDEQTDLNNIVGIKYSLRLHHI